MFAFSTLWVLSKIHHQANIFRFISTAEPHSWGSLSWQLLRRSPHNPHKGFSSLLAGISVKSEELSVHIGLIKISQSVEIIKEGNVREFSAAELCRNVCRNRIPRSLAQLMRCKAWAGSPWCKCGIISAAWNCTLGRTSPSHSRSSSLLPFWVNNKHNPAEWYTWHVYYHVL